jgi:ribosome maturation factor RimP
MTEPETPPSPAAAATTDSDIPRHEGLELRIANTILPSLTQMGYELVRVQVSGKERPVVQIMADRADGAPFVVEDCETISHGVGAVLDVSAVSYPAYIETSVEVQPQFVNVLAGA